MALSDQVRSRREAAGLTQAELSDRSGVHRNTISAIERGQSEGTMRIVGKLAGALDCSPMELISEFAEPAEAAV